MLRNRLFMLIASACRVHKRTVVTKLRRYAPLTVSLLGTAYCEDSEKQNKYKDANDRHKYSWDDMTLDRLEHEFLIRQATTVNVNAATQLLTVTLVAIQDTSERLREALSKEICLVQQAMDWGNENTPPQHWEQLVALRGSLDDLNHNLRMLVSYMDYAEKLATVAAEISYLSGNVAASDAICERLEHATRTCNIQKQLNHSLLQESLEMQQKAIITSPGLEEKLKDSNINHK